VPATGGSTVGISPSLLDDDDDDDDEEDEDDDDDDDDDEEDADDEEESANAAALVVECPFVVTASVLMSIFLGRWEVRLKMINFG
jgi:hypothetical protein